jgi:hypothetical protein
MDTTDAASAAGAIAGGDERMVWSYGGRAAKATPGE